MAVVRVGEGFYLDMTYLDVSGLRSGTTTQATADRMTLKFNDQVSDVFTGSFTYGANGLLTGGTLTGMGEYIGGDLAFEIYDFSVSIPAFMDYIRRGDTYGALSAMLKGDDTVEGGPFNDALGGLGGADMIRGWDGNDVLFGGDGEDIMLGDDGDDDILGQAGNDTIWGGEGSDSLDGGAGSDWLNGQEGDDWLYGGDGNDKLTGGSGADWFAFEDGNGNDEVTDFSIAEGDKVNLHKGQAYSIGEFEGSALIILATGEHMELIGVPPSALARPADWLVMT
jgi:Ca2+-binding RTX toxin-like protein